MEGHRFNTLVNDFLDEIKERLVRKGKEYAGKIDCLENFKRAGALQNTTPEAALFGIMAKHIVSVAMMVEKEDFENLDVWDEKLGDIIGFCLLMRARIYEQTDDPESRTDAGRECYKED